MPMTATIQAIAKWRDTSWSTCEILEHFGLKGARNAAAKRGDHETERNYNRIANVLGELVGEARTDLRAYPNTVRAINNAKG